MTYKEHEKLFKTFVEWKVWGFKVLRELNKNNIEETKARVLEFRAFHKENWEKYSGDHNLSGELIDLLRAISQIETKIKELEENQ